MLAYRAPTYLLVFRRALRLTCGLLCGSPPDKGQSATDYAADLIEQFHDIHHYACQHLKVARDQMKVHYDRLVNLAGFQESDQVWLYRQTWKREKLMKLHSSWEGLYKAITWINDMVYQIQQHPRSKMRRRREQCHETGGSAWERNNEK
jgi:hypothetical protein